MDAVKFINENARMCKEMGSCSKCPAYGCCTVNPKNAEKLVEIVEKWSAEHPQKTMIQDLLEKYPNVPLAEDGFPQQLCPHYLGYERIEMCSGTDCDECWSRPLEIE